MSGRFFMFSATKASERTRSTLRKSRKSHVVVVLGRQRDRSTKKVCCTCKIIAFFFNKPIDYLFDTLVGVAVVVVVMHLSM